jgi:hypothetical protein
MVHIAADERLCNQQGGTRYTHHAKRKTQNAKRKTQNARNKAVSGILLPTLLT